MKINEQHQCVFCGVVENHATIIECHDGEQGPIAAHTYRPPAGSMVMLGQVVDGKAIVTIHEDVTADEIALLMSAFMDRISRFEHIKNDPSKIMQALMGGMS